MNAPSAKPVKISDNAAPKTVAPVHNEPAPVKVSAPEAPKPIVNQNGITSTPKGVEAKYAAVNRLPTTRIQLAGYLHNPWDVTCPAGTVVEQLKNPDYWAHVAANLKPQDIIHAYAEDCGWFARLFVVACDRTWARVALLEFHDFSSIDAEQPLAETDNYDIKWTTMGKWTITDKRHPGKPAIKDNFENKVDAYVWLDGYVKSINK